MRDNEDRSGRDESVIDADDGDRPREHRKRETESNFEDISPRPSILSGTTRRVRTECGTLFITINTEGDKIREAFITKGKSGGCTHSLVTALGRVISLALRGNVCPNRIAATLRDIKCPRHSVGGGDQLSGGCVDAISKVLRIEYESTRHHAGDAK